MVHRALGSGLGTRAGQWTLGLGLVFWLGASATGTTAAASAGDRNVTLANEYVTLIVNATGENTGRFSIQTTGGDPDRTSDDRQPLSYGSDQPWTSFTTVRVDGKDYIFGGRTSKRAGKQGLFGEMISGPRIVDGRAIEAVWRLGGVDVLQRLSFAVSSTTGLPDTARIEYVLTDKDVQAHQVGLRLVIDTMLGDNDGAPFRVGDKALTSDTALTKGQLPEFWQAFDTLSNPKITAQGTLKGGEVTPPDQVVFTNWGSLADALWKFALQPGRDFTRKGEFELDSALALYYEPTSLAPGESRTIVAHYGVGGITIAPGRLALGVTAPAKVVAGEVTSFPVIAYIQNTGESDIRDAVVTLTLPDGLALADGQSVTKQLGTIPKGAAVQTAWMLRLAPGAKGEQRFALAIQARNVEPNQVERVVKVVSPAKLELSVRSPLSLSVQNEKIVPALFPLEVTVTNVGEADTGAVRLTLGTGLGIAAADGEAAVKFIGLLRAGAKATVTWQIRPTGKSTAQQETAYLVKAQSAGVPEAAKKGFVNVPKLVPKVRMLVCATRDEVAQNSEGVLKVLKPGAAVKVGDLVEVTIRATNFRQFVGASLAISFDPARLQVVGGSLGVSRGQAFANANWSEPKVDNRAGRITGISGSRGSVGRDIEDESLVTVLFRVVGPGTASVRLDEVRVEPGQPDEFIRQNLLQLNLSKWELGCGS